jgi:hypothetical protein
MQPKPMAETSRLLFPSLRVFILLMSFAKRKGCFMRGLGGDELGIRTHQDSILARLGEAPALNDIARSMAP